jgi:hypothetical protein
MAAVAFVSCFHRGRGDTVFGVPLVRGRKGSQPQGWLRSLAKMRFILTGNEARVMEITPLTFDSRLERYEEQARHLLEAFNSGDVDAIRLVKNNHPRLRKLSDSEVESATLELPDAQLAVSSFYRFESWPALVEFAEASANQDSELRLKSAVEAVIRGDAATLEELWSGFNYPKSNHLAIVESLIAAGAEVGPDMTNGSTSFAGAMREIHGGALAGE